jgi:hypothetical protein
MAGGAGAGREGGVAGAAAAAGGVAAGGAAGGGSAGAAAPEAGGEWVWGWLAGAAPVLAYRAPQVAAQLLRQAVAQVAQTDPRREVLEAALVTVAFLLVRDEEVERIGSRLLAFARDRDRAAGVAWVVGHTLSRNDRPIEALGVVEKALERRAASEVWTARLHAERAFAMAEASHPDTVNAARKALALAEAAGDRFAAGYALFVLCLVTSRPSCGCPATPSKATSPTSWPSSARDHGWRSSARPCSTQRPPDTRRPADGQSRVRSRRPARRPPLMPAQPAKSPGQCDDGLTGMAAGSIPGAR